MSLYIRVFTNFFTHRKTERLKVAIGNDAYWVPPRLWAYAANNQPDGDFSDYSNAEISQFIGFTGDAGLLIQTLIRVGFLDPDKKIHDWATHSGYHDLYAARARKAAKAKWDKERASSKTKINGSPHGKKRGTEQSRTELIPGADRS